MDSLIFIFIFDIYLFSVLVIFLTGPSTSCSMVSLDPSMAQGSRRDMIGRLSFGHPC